MKKITFVLVFVCCNAFSQSPHSSIIQTSTDCQAFIQDTILTINTLGVEEYAKELWKLQSNGKILSGTETSTQSQANYDRNLNPTKINSYISRMYQNTAKKELNKYRQIPSRSYMYDNLILFAEQRWNLNFKNKIVNRYNELNSNFGE